MTGIRRWYIYLVTLVSLQALTWGLINLLQNLLVFSRRAGIASETDSLSWQIAIIIVTLPVFLVHWLWAQRLVGRDRAEQTSWVRGLYLHGTTISFLIPALNYSYDLLRLLFQLLIQGKSSPNYLQLTPGGEVLSYLLPILVLAPLLFYQYRLVAAELPTAVFLTTTRRWHHFGFAAGGVTMTAIGAIVLLQWLLKQFGGQTAVINTTSPLPAELARLVVGIPLWLFFWRQAQTLFPQSPAEAHSTLRKFYLYLIIFVVALTAVAAATGILAGILRSLLGLAPQGDIRDPIAMIVVTAALWFYHAKILQQDIQASQEQPKQATIRRLYWYLIAAIGLAAVLVGLGGNISVLIRSFSTAFVTQLREQLAWFTAALVAGLPVWLLPWRQAQLAAAHSGEIGQDEREDIVRKIYLYFYIFVATLTALGSAIYIVYRLVGLVLGSDSGNLGNDLPHAIAYGLIAVAVWLYHGAVLRQDSRLLEAPTLPDALRVALIGGESFAQPLLIALRQAFPFATLQTVSGNETPQSEVVLAEAELIIAPWPLADEDGGWETAVSHSPAPKLLIPMRQKGWEWVGVEPWNLDNIISETVQTAYQIVVGSPIKRQRTSLGTIISIVAGVLGLFILMMILISAFFNLLV